MAIESLCQTCGHRLRVGDEHAGKLARCPSCHTVYTVPIPAQVQSPTSNVQSHSRATLDVGLGTMDSANGRWHLKTPDGLTYGPVPRGDLDQWQREGRITAQSQVMEEADGRWMWAGQLYPQLQSMAADAPAKTVVSETINPYAPPGYAYGGQAPGMWLEPHHGAVVLVLGILGFAFCGVLAWVAVILGIIDLNKMARGTMDPGGRGLTIVGLVFGALKVLLHVIWLLFMLAQFV